MIHWWDALDTNGTYINLNDDKKFGLAGGPLVFYYLKNYTLKQNSNLN